MTGTGGEAAEEVEDAFNTRQMLSLLLKVKQQASQA